MQTIDEKELYKIAKKVKKDRPKVLKEDMDKRLAEWQLFYLYNLDIFNEDYLGIKLKYFQRSLLLDCAYYDVMDIVASRGLSKSFTIAALANSLALLLPNINILITSFTLNQSNVIIKEKLDDMFTSESSVKVDSKVLKQLRKDGYIKFVKDPTSGGLIVEYKNGSKIFAVNCGESARGKRANVVIVDEAVLIKKTDYDSIIEPTLEPYYFKGLMIPPKQIFLTSAKTRDNWMWKHLVTTVNEHYKYSKSKEGLKYGFFAGDIFTSVANKIQLKSQYLARKKGTDDFAFQTEYLNIWLGENRDAIFKYQDFHNAQTISNAWRPTTPMEAMTNQKIPIVKEEGVIRFMACDIAVIGGKNNDNSVYMLGKLDTNTGERYVEYITSRSGMNSVLQVMTMKRLFYDYECDYFVMDSQGVGNAIFDIFTMPTDDFDFGRTVEGGNPYPAWDLNKEKILQISSDSVIAEKSGRAISLNGEEVMIPVSGSTDINSQMHYSVWMALRNEKLLLLRDKSEIESILNEKDPKFFMKSAEEKADILIPHYETDLMINETIALNVIRDINGKMSVKESRSGLKDRYMTLAMFNHFADKLEIKFAKDKQADEFNADDWTCALS